MHACMHITCYENKLHCLVDNASVAAAVTVDNYDYHVAMYLYYNDYQCLYLFLTFFFQVANNFHFLNKAKVLILWSLLKLS